MWNRGCASFSTRTTFSPRWASNAPIVEPAGPPPTISASEWSVIMGW